MVFYLYFFPAYIISLFYQKNNLEKNVHNLFFVVFVLHIFLMSVFKAK